MNPTFLAKVRDISNQGYGVIDHPDGHVLFALGAFPGDEGYFEIIKLKGRYGYARLVQITVPTEHRVSVSCPHQGTVLGSCGGCPWMGISYRAQLALKRKMLTHALLRQHLIESEDSVPEVIGSANIFSFRNRAQFKTNGNVLGFVSRFSRQIVDVQQCLVLNEKLKLKLKLMRAKLPNRDWTPGIGYDWNYLEVDDDQPLEEFPHNQRRPFKQGNYEQNLAMKSWLKDQLKDLDRSMAILELFGGSGNFTETFLHEGFKNISVAEIAEDGISEFQKKSLHQVNLINANLYRPSDWKEIKRQTQRPDLLFLDPPRDGFDKLGMFVQQFGLPKKIIYISCNLETYISDVSQLKKKGYKPQIIQGLDQFPHTPHLEVLSTWNHT